MKRAVDGKVSFTQKAFTTAKKSIKGATSPALFHLPQFMLLLSLLVIPLISACGKSETQSMAEEFLEALKKRQLRTDNIIDLHEKYHISILAVREHIFFPIALLDYEFLSEESIPRGLVTHSLDDLIEHFAQDQPSDLHANKFSSLKGFYLETKKEGRVFIVKGTITNNAQEPQRLLRIKGTLLDRAGTPLLTREVYAGVTFTEEEVKNNALAEIREGLEKQTGKESIKPGQTVPFMIVFNNLPDDLDGFEVENIQPDVEPDEEAVQSAKMVFESIKMGLNKDELRDLKIDEKNHIITYYDDKPCRYKLHYLLTVTNRLGHTLKKNGYVTIEEGLDGKEIVEFKY